MPTEPDTTGESDWSEIYKFFGAARHDWDHHCRKLAITEPEPEQLIDL